MKTKSMMRVVSAFIAAVFGTVAIPDVPLMRTNAYAEGEASSIIFQEQKKAAQSSLQWGDVNEDGVINADDAEAVLKASIKSCPQADVNADGVLDKTDSDMITSYNSGEIGYFPVGIYYSPDISFVTRAEWIHRLAEGMSMEMPADGKLNEYYTDLTDCPYAEEITLAANYGVIDVMGDKFNPDVFVTRDFAAHTLNYCLGYPNNNIALTFSDVDAVYYQYDAQISINREWFSLENGNFCPSMYVTLPEAEFAWKDMEKSVASVRIDENAKSTLVLDDSVVDMTDAEKVVAENGKFVITGSKANIKTGQDFSFIIDGVNLVRRAKNVAFSSDNKTVTITAIDSDESVVNEAEGEGFAFVDYDGIETLADGIEISVEEEPIPQALPPERLVKASASGTANLANTKISISGEYKLNNGESVKLSGSLSNIKIPYALKTSGLSVEKLQIGFNADVTVSGTYSAQKKGDFTLDIARIPVSGIGVMNVWVYVKAYCSVSGSVTLSYSCGLNSGISYTKGQGFQSVREFKTGQFSLAAEAEEKLGLKAGLELCLGTKSLGGVYAAAGEKGNVNFKNTSGASVTCTNLSAYVFGEVGAEMTLPGIPDWKITYEFWNKNNSPMKLNLHWENGRQVPKCTQGHDFSTVSSTGSYGGGASGGYESGYGYSSGYGYGMHGSGWFSRYYSAMMAFSELEPPFVISEDMLLTDDLDVDTEIYLKAKLDLNGHKLNAKQNIYFENGGKLYINGGSAEVDGNLDFTGDGFRSIIMENKDDYLKINGEAHISKADSVFKAGTLEFTGDIVNSYVTSTDMHKVIISGTGNQVVNFGNSNIGMLEIKNSDSRTLNLTGMLHVDTATNIDGKELKFKCPDSATGSILRLSKTNAKKITVDGNVILRRLEVSDAEVVINGDVLQNENGSFSSGVNIFLTKSKMTVNGNFVADNRLTLNDASMTVTGDYKISGYWIENDPYNPQLTMKNRNDSITVGGNFSCFNSGSAEPSVNNGTITVSGDITLGNVKLADNCKVILKGDKDASVYSSSASAKIGMLEIENSDKRKIYAEGYFSTDSTNCSDKPLNIISRGGNLNLGKLKCSELNVEGDVTLSGTNNFVCDKVSFSDDVTESGNVTCTAKTIDTSGAWTISSGSLDMQATAFTCKDFNMNGGSIDMNKGKLIVTRDFTQQGGSVTMTNAKALIDVSGDFTVSGGNDGNQTAGTYRIAGDISGSHSVGKDVKFVLCGKEDQSIVNENYDTRSDYCRFGILSIENASGRKIHFEGNLDAVTISADSDTISMVSDGTVCGKLVGCKLLCDLEIKGDVLLRAKNIDLNGHTVNVKGNVYQNEANLVLNSGKLLVSGDYIIANEYDSAVHKPCSGILSMLNDKDYLQVGGDFETITKVDHSKYLTAGTLELKGDFTQSGEGTEYAFPASGTHKAILSGDQKQNITFESYDSSHFNNIILKQDMSQYTFSDNPCWTALGNDDEQPETTTKTTATSETTTSITSATSSIESSTKATDKTTDPTSSKTNETTTETTTKISSVTSSTEISITATVNTSSDTVSSMVTTGISTESQLGDINGDNIIDGRDATAVLTEYAIISTGKDFTFDEKQKEASDANKDGIIDGRDATLILTYYAYISTGHDITIIAFINQMTGQDITTTDVKITTTTTTQ